MTAALPNPFMTYQPSRQAMIDAACLRAVEDALDPPPTFLALPPLHLDRELGRNIQQGRLPSLSAVLRELSELAGLQGVGARRS